MDYAASHVVYVDNRVSRGLDGRHIQKTRSDRQDRKSSTLEETKGDADSDCLKAILGEIEEVRLSLRNLLSVFDGVHTCTSGSSCMDKIESVERERNDHRPLLVVVGTCSEDTLEHAASESEAGEASWASISTQYDGNTLIRHLSSQVSSSNLSKRVVPLAMVYDHPSLTQAAPTTGVVPKKASSRPSSGMFTSQSRKNSTPTDQRISSKAITAETNSMARYIDLGAVEVLPSPLPKDRLTSLVAHAYRAHNESLREHADHLRKRKARKLSWLGNNDERPYAYLREKMVSELMTGICNPDEISDQADSQELPELDASREELLKRAVGSWKYSGHDFDDDELTYGACFMLQHALSLPELEKWRISNDELKAFLVASRAAYNAFVNYHNFRHVIDVMQAVFQFLIHIGTLPPFPAGPVISGIRQQPSPIAALLKPFDALTLLITAIGHDVGHPGVNNAFLVSLNAPLAQLYNDKSVLEAFHCAAYSQILRRHWKAAFEDTSMRGLMINSILATDMGVHMKYMSDLGNLQEKLHHNQGTDGWSAQILDEYRILTCALLIKCADISNVARPFDIALKWADSLQLEFANQGVMERDLGIPTTLFGGPPELGNAIKLGKSQIGFMNIFARPLFEAVTDILPAMSFAVDQIKANQMVWSQRIKGEEEKAKLTNNKSLDRPISPRSQSPHRPTSHPESSHPEGLPASSSPPNPVALSPALLALSTGEHLSPQSSTVDSDAPNSDNSRRVSSGQPLAPTSSDPASNFSFSRRSSGALSASNIPHSIITARRTSNSSPSQLQLGQDASRSQTNSSVTTTENQQPNGYASDDTLSQSLYPLTNKAASESQPMPSYGGRDTGHFSSKTTGSDHIRSGQSSTSQPSNRPYTHSGHQRSSSGAHTTNTTVSQSTPYSPTGTQATSVLTVESDEDKSQGRLGSGGSYERHGVPNMINTDRNWAAPNGLDGTHETEPKPSLMNNGSTKDTSNIGYRSIGRKGSRFKLSFFKKRGKGVEPAP